MTPRTKSDFERRYFDLVRQDSALYYPLEVRYVHPVAIRAGDGDYDLELDLAYGDRMARFAVVVKGRSAPVVVRGVLEQLRGQTRTDRHPLLVVPYLSKHLIRMLEQAAISAVDASGNYLIQTSDFVAVRLDQPNRFPEPKAIRNIYSGNSSIVGRYFLREPRGHAQVNDVARGIVRRGGGLSLATISKVLNGLVDDLIVIRRPGSIELAEAPELLQRLTEGYRPPVFTETLRLNLGGTQGQMGDLLTSELGAESWIWSGSSSAMNYASTTPPGLPIAYTRATLESLQRLRRFEETRFYTCEVRLTSSNYAYFDAENQWASIVQTYLELMQLDKRDREIAEDIRELILRFMR